jgi:hypothetical protein
MIIYEHIHKLDKSDFQRPQEICPKGAFYRSFWHISENFGIQQPNVGTHG